MVSLPMRERGLKYYRLAGRDIPAESLPMRERGLKWVRDAVDLREMLSLPMRERGLKSDETPGVIRTRIVAPHAGAWIEITCRTASWGYWYGRSPCGSVD